MPHRARRVQVWGSWCLLCFVAAMLISVKVGGQDLERRIKIQEDVRADTRLATLETRLDSIEFLGKAILVAVIGQLVLNGMNFRTRSSAEAKRSPIDRISLD